MKLEYENCNESLSGTKVNGFPHVDDIVTNAINTTLVVLERLHPQLIWVGKWLVWIFRRAIPAPLRVDNILKITFKGFLQYRNMRTKSCIVQ